MRWMLARHHDYESGREAYAPFDKLVDETDETAKLIAGLALMVWMMSMRWRRT